MQTAPFRVRHYQRNRRAARRTCIAGLFCSRADPGPAAIAVCVRRFGDHRSGCARPGRRCRADGPGHHRRVVPRRELRPLRRRAAVSRDAARAGVRMALLSNTLGHWVEEIVAHFALDEFMAAPVSSLETGAVKPAPRMFSTLFALLGEAAGDCVMVGDSLEDDVTDAEACGCPAILLDRAGRRRDLDVPRIESLAELPAALGLPSV